MYSALPTIALISPIHESCIEVLKNGASTKARFWLPVGGLLMLVYFL